MRNGQYIINKEVIKMLESDYRFTEKVDFKSFDYLTVDDNYLEFVEEDNFQLDDNGFYEKVSDGLVLGCRRDNLSGVFVPFYYK